MKLKRVMAVFVLLLVVLGAAFYGSYKSLKDIRNCNDYSYDTSGFSIYEGLVARQDAAENILKIAGNYEDETEDLTAKIYELERSVNILRNNFEDAETAAENKKLDTLAQDLVEYLKENVAVTEEDTRYLRGQLAELKAQQDKINRSSYHEQVDAFNTRLDAFPGNIMRALGLLDPLVDYR